MTTEELEAHLRQIGYTVELLSGADRKSYLVIRNYSICSGHLAGTTCDIAIERVAAVPYVFPPVIHTRPALVPMDMSRYRTQASPVGSDWQYWSRLLRTQPPSPRSIVMHLATIFSEVGEDGLR